MAATIEPRSAAPVSPRKTPGTTGPLWQVLIALALGALSARCGPISPQRLDPKGARRRLSSNDQDGDRAIIFCTVVAGISPISRMQEVGRIGVKELSISR